MLTIEPNEEGTAVVTIKPVDHEGTALVFEDLFNPKWQLMKPNGDIVNGRSFDACDLTSLTWVIQGDDLALETGTSPKRIIAVQFEYNSDIGIGLPCRVEEEFNIRELVSQS